MVQSQPLTSHNQSRSSVSDETVVSAGFAAVAQPDNFVCEAFAASSVDELLFWSCHHGLSICHAPFVFDAHACAYTPHQQQQTTLSQTLGKLNISIRRY